MIRAFFLAALLLFTASAYGQEYPPIPEATITPPPPKSDTIVYDAVEMSPEFPGGQTRLNNFRNHNLKQPREAKKITGEVIISALVEKDGTLTDIQVIQSLHPACDKEALRFIKLMPPWKPGSMELKPVRSRVKIPVKFGKD